MFRCNFTDFITLSIFLAENLLRGHIPAGQYFPGYYLPKNCLPDIFSRTFSPGHFLPEIFSRIFSPGHFPRPGYFPVNVPQSPPNFPSKLLPENCVPENSSRAFFHRHSPRMFPRRVNFHIWEILSLSKVSS